MMKKHEMKEHELFAGGHRLAATTWGDVGNGQPTIVMMHGGLDCITTWKDLPQVLVEASGWPVLAYDRYGYGRSESLVGGREPSYRREESGPVFGEVLRHFGIDKALMFGHSDGGAMSVLAAAAHPGVVCGVLACSPTIAIDPFMVDAMGSARRAYEHEGLREKLQRHHGGGTDAMFWGWYKPWASPKALEWNMSAEIAAIRCPVSALFGNQDEYGWRPSAMALFEHGTMALEVIALSGVGHHPQQRARGETLQQLQRLIGRMG
ncbi:alpha/beta hydrolase [Hydrogenophaga sp. NH-16]|uniref:alpha/beta fold hydrolase n=1 Tax=Hydrogenophaga sp. NH-16 TaxID=2184519 RepID=UPI000FDBD83F|nr:alpha/beta hydrolase [Hydrogenophaga sp. NH-16]